MGAADASRTVRITFVAEDQSVAAVTSEIGGNIDGVADGYWAAAKASQSFGSTAKQAGQQAATGFGRVKAEAKSAQAAIKGAVSAGQSFVSNMKSVGLLGLGFSQVAGAAREVLRVVDELATESLQTQQVTENLQISIEGASEGFKGYVSNIDLAVAANRAVQFGVVETGEEFAGVARGVQAIAEKTGQSSAKLLDQFVVGTARKSAARLDDLGILINQTKAERIWAEELGTTRDKLTLLQKEEAFQKVALLEIAKAGDKAASSIDGFAVTVVRGKIELQNAKSSFLGFDDNIGKVREGLRQLTDEQLRTVSFADFAAEGSGAIKRANAELEKFGITVADVEQAALRTGIAFDELIKGQQAANVDKAAAKAAKIAKLEREESVKLLREEADEAAFTADVLAAGGEAQSFTNELVREAVELRRQAAELAGDEVEQLKLTRELAVLEAKAAAPRRGGAGPSREARVLAAGEQRVAQLETEARIAGILAEDAEAEAEAERASFEAARQRLSLELEALEATKARGAFARQELENQLAANRAAAAELSAEETAAEQERVNELIGEAVSLETARSAGEANAAARRFELLGREFEAREILRQQAELELQANPPEDEIARIEQQDALAQLTFEREMDRRDREETAAKAQADLAEQHHAEELKRIKEKQQKQKAAIDASSRFLQTGQQFASAVIGAAIKDEDKRAQAELKARGVMAIATGALETVRAVAAFASFNVVQGGLHTAAAALAFTQGGIMLSGNLPGRGSAGGGGEAATAAPRADRETGEAARIVESIPAADREPRQQPTTQQQGGGNVTTIENLNVTGAIDDDTIEKVRIGLDNVNNGLEAAG